MKNPVGPEDAKLFDGFVLKWQQILSLGDWRIERGAKPARSAMASVEFTEGARLATYKLVALRSSLNALLSACLSGGLLFRDIALGVPSSEKEAAHSARPVLKS